MKTIMLFAVCLCLSLGLQAQYSVSKLTVAKNQVLELRDSDISIDTLIMQDKSQVVFLAPDTKLVIKNAFIGKNCKWDASGKRELPGRNLDVTVTFISLEKLKIRTTGGNGRNGEDGLNGTDGGDGGDISLNYSVQGFPVSFNEGKSQSIYVESYGGLAGKGGSGGAQSTQPPRATSQNASWNQGSVQQSANVSANVSANPSGVSADIPQPKFVQANAEGTFSAGVQTGPSQSVTAGGSSRRGMPGRPGNFTYKKID